MYTEEEAKKKNCQIGRIMAVMTIDNRNCTMQETIDFGRCLASDCVMGWRWDKGIKKLGYCGLGGAPRG